MKTQLLFFAFLFVFGVAGQTQTNHTIFSPDGKLKFTFLLHSGTMFYTIGYNNRPVVLKPKW